MPRTNFVHQAPHRCPAEPHEALLHRASSNWSIPSASVRIEATAKRSNAD
jgi:hypothetical protein